MGKLTCNSSADETIASGANLTAAQAFTTGRVSSDVAFVTTGDGTADLSAPKQQYTLFTSVTGVQNLDLTALTRPGGGTHNMGHIREITVSNLSTNVLDVLTVGGALTTPFVGPFGAGTHTIKVEAGETKTICCKPYGAGYLTSSAKNFQLDFGARTFSAAVVIKGYA